MGKASRRKQDKRQQPTPLSQEEAAEVCRLVRDDLVFLRSLNYSRPSRTEIRVASSILRRLLHEGMYFGAWRIAELEEEPRISAVDLQGVVSGIELRYIHYAYAGGAKTEGAHHKGYVLLVIPRAEAEAEGQDVVLRRVQQRIKPGVTRTFLLQEFCVSPAVISGGASVSRVDVVRYVANKLGGGALGQSARRLDRSRRLEASIARRATLGCRAASCGIIRSDLDCAVHCCFRRYFPIH